MLLCTRAPDTPTPPHRHTILHAGSTVDMVRFECGTFHQQNKLLPREQCKHARHLFASIPFDGWLALGLLVHNRRCSRHPYLRGTSVYRRHTQTHAGVLGKRDGAYLVFTVCIIYLACAFAHDATCSCIYSHALCIHTY